MSQDASLPFEDSPSAAKIRVIVVDDHAVVRQGLRMFIDMQDYMEVIGEGGNGLEAIQMVIYDGNPAKITVEGGKLKKK
jgi:chemotaxis response regulator CheB